MNIVPEVSSLFASPIFDVGNSHVLHEDHDTKQPKGLTRPDSLLVELTPHEYANALAMALIRVVIDGPEVLALQVATDALARAAISKASGADGLGDADVEICHAPIPSRLRLYKTDAKLRPYVLVIGSGLVFEAVGWMAGKEIMSDERKVDSGWAVEINNLRPMKELLSGKHVVSDERLKKLVKKPETSGPIDFELEMLRRPSNVDELWQMAKIAFGAR